MFFVVFVPILDRRLNKIKYTECINNRQIHCAFILLSSSTYFGQPSRHLQDDFLVLRLELQLYGCVSLRCIQKLLTSAQNLEFTDGIQYE